MEDSAFRAFCESRGIRIFTSLQETQRSKIYSGTFRSNPAVIKLQKMPQVADYTIMEREYLALTNLYHKNILQLYDAVWTEHKGDYYLMLVTEPCETDLGKDCMRRKAAEEPYTEEELWVILCSLVDALAYMQTQNCAHRDVKPANVFLQNRRVKLGDLGTAKFFDPGLETDSTVAGTPAFLSPLLKAALMTDDIRVQHDMYKSDCYSLGVSLYALAILKPPLPFISAKITDQESAKLIESIPYSRPLKDAIHWMVRREEADRCDFLQLKEWLMQPNMPQWNTEEVQLSETVECLVCGTVHRRCELAGNVVVLDCDPLNHLFCNEECFSTFLQSATQPYLCPSCQTPVAEELTRRSRISRIKETGSSVLRGLKSKAFGWFGTRS